MKSLELASQVLRQARTLVTKLEPATEVSLQILGRIRYRLCQPHTRPLNPEETILSSICRRHPGLTRA
ncbi:hypothetical protein PoB_002934400 [Plakobranchus ocellatus]|uniref:Uncharacterized protein n=1 Tax=Plakobranchus ocellatus TaxID=259542 RepID=A0AAV4A580_9GAST|nr:hypothetical protein PoB_002934400 [Plakobranchus ocellatus]